MNFLSTLLLCILGAVCVASSATKEEILPITSRLTTAQLLDLQRRVAGCNANICFAIDGSDSISAADFEAQKLFVQDLSIVIDPFSNPSEFAAMQYANTTSVISRLTPNFQSFALAVGGTTQIGGSTSLTRGINFCTRQFRRRSGEANKIVLLGAGRGERGTRAVRRANRFRSMGGEVCVVGAGFSDDRTLLAIAGGDPAKVFQVDNFIDILEVQFVIENIALDICGVPDAGVASVARDLNKE